MTDVTPEQDSARSVPGPPLPSHALSHTHGETDTPLLEATIGDNFDETASRFPDREALVDVAQGKRWTYAELRGDVDDLARALLAVGVKTGDRVGIWAPNCSEWTLTQYATAKIGAILVNINPSYRSHELKYVLDQAGISTLVSAEAFKSSNYHEMIDEVRDDLDDLERVVYIGSDSWHELVARADEVPETVLHGIQAGLSNTDPINIQYTSGTTGFPKGATLSHRNILNNGYFVGELCDYTEADRVCIPVPFYHCFGMVMGNLACTSHGACMVIPAPGFDPAATLQATQDEKVTSLYGVPTMFIAEWNLPGFADYDLSSVRTGIMAGSPCPAELMKQLIASGIEEMTIAYGMTETSPVSTQNHTDDTFEQKVGTVGRSPRRRLDAHRRHRGDARRRLRRDHRPHQGHGHPRGRERLPARGRGVSLHPSRHPRRAGDRGARSEVRRGAVRVDPDEGRGAAPHGRVGARLRRREACSLQGSPLRRDRRRVPDDRHRKDPQDRDARDHSDAPRARLSRSGPIRRAEVRTRAERPRAWRFVTRATAAPVGFGATDATEPDLKG